MKGKYFAGQYEGLCFKRLVLGFYSGKGLHTEEVWSWVGSWCEKARRAQAVISADQVLQM